MAGQPLWKSLKDLVDADAALTNIRTNILQVTKNQASLQEKLTQLELSMQQSKNVIMQAQKSVDAVELRSKELSDAEKQKRIALDNAMNSKAYEALRKELEAIMIQHNQLEDGLIQAWHNLDIAKQQAAKNLTLSLAEKERITQQANTHQEQLTSLKENLEAAIVSRETQAQQLSPDWLSRYERMKHSVTNPIVPVIQSTCSACFYAILIQDIDALQRGGILPCRGCYRLLYYNKE